MGTPKVGDLKAMIRMKRIKNNMVAMDIVNLAMKYYGPYVGEIKVKITRIRPTPVVRKIIEITD